MLRLISFIALAALLLTRAPAAADDWRYLGYYQNVTFSNNTNFCIWLTLGESTKSSGLTTVMAVGVPPHKQAFYPPKGESGFIARGLRIKTEALNQQNCTGGVVASREIFKTATSPGPNDVNVSLVFAAVAQLDIGGGKWNLYWGADKFLGPENRQW